MHVSELLRIARSKAADKTKSGFSVALPDYYRLNYLSQITSAGSNTKQLQTLIAQADHRLTILSRAQTSLGPTKVQAAEDMMELLDAEDSKINIDSRSIMDVVAMLVQLVHD